MGPLQGFRIIEMAGIGPTQLCGMLLADMGAEIVRIRRPGAANPGVDIPSRYNLMNRSRPTVAVDLKSPRGADLVLRLCERADAIFEGFRPGVMEKLGLGPDVCRARNPRLVYGRVTGWGQDGPLAGAVGHDTDYIALAGALHCIGDADRPPPLPLNLVADFGGGALDLALGMLAAMLEANRSGNGQVVDAAMLDGVASMLTLFYGLRAAGSWSDRRQSNLLDGAAPFARCYETSDGRYIAVCALETTFFAALLQALGIDDIDVRDQYDMARWPGQCATLANVFRTKTRDEWSAILAGTDACAAPVLSLDEATQHPHNVARRTFVEVGGIRQPAAAPRFSRTQSEIRHGPLEIDGLPRDFLRRWGIDADELTDLL